MLNCLIVDDEPPALDLLGSYVGRTPFLQLAGRAGSAVEALRVLTEAKPGNALGRDEIDLIFLDIRLSGIELSRLLAERGRGRTKVIFITAFGQYALEGFRVDALDYLLKPVSYPEFLRAAMKAHEWFVKTSGVGAAGVLPRAGDRNSGDSLWVRSEYRQVRIWFRDVLYVEGVKDYLRIWLRDGSDVMTQMSLKNIETQLPMGEFVRVHRSYIVRLAEVRTIAQGRIVFGKVQIPVSESYRDLLMERLAGRGALPEKSL